MLHVGGPIYAWRWRISSEGGAAKTRAAPLGENAVVRWCRRGFGLGSVWWLFDLTVNER